MRKRKQNKSQITIWLGPQLVYTFWDVLGNLNYSYLVTNLSLRPIADGIIDSLKYNLTIDFNL